MTRRVDVIPAESRWLVAVVIGMDEPWPHYPDITEGYIRVSRWEDADHRALMGPSLRWRCLAELEARRVRWMMRKLRA